jgi:hypothetical protein
VFFILLFIFLTTIRGVEPQSCNPAVVSYVVRDEKGSVLNETELQTVYAQLPKKIGNAALAAGQVSLAEDGQSFYWPESVDWSKGKKKSTLEFANAITCTMQLSEVTLIYHDRRMHLIFDLEIDRTQPNRRPVVDSLPFEEGTFVLDWRNWSGGRDRIIPARQWKKVAGTPQPDLRIADKTFKLLQMTKLQEGRVSLVYHSFPFSTVY